MTEAGPQERHRTVAVNVGGVVVGGGSWSCRQLSEKMRDGRLVKDTISSPGFPRHGGQALLTISTSISLITAFQGRRIIIAGARRVTSEPRQAGPRPVFFIRSGPLFFPAAYLHDRGDYP